MGESTTAAAAQAAPSERPEFRRAHLATLFLQSAHPLSTVEIVEQVYNNPVNLELGKKELSLDSARKALKRDIDALKSTGLIIESVGRTDDGQSTWQVNRELSFTQGVALSEEDAVFLDIACLPLLGDPGFPERDELRLALAKIDRLFDATATDALTASSIRDSEVLVAVRDALNARTAIDISYTTRAGIHAVRRVAPLAFFDLRSVLYVVCALVDEDGSLIPGSERTFRIDRIEDARRVARVSYEIPEGFDVNDFKRLPFQIGSEDLTCTFFVPAELRGAIGAVADGRGVLTPAEGGAIWEVEGADTQAAAAWAVAYGIRPLAPDGLAAAWRGILEEARHG